MGLDEVVLIRTEGKQARGLKLTELCLAVQPLVFPHVPVCRTDEKQNPFLTSISSFTVTDNKNNVSIINVKNREMGLICSMHGIL
jgi:hypothetical protein